MRLPTGILTGSFAFDTTDPARPDYTGRFTQTFGDNSNGNNQLATSTFTVRGTGTDGSTVQFHTVAHITAETIDFSTDPPTVAGITVNFDRLRCGQPRRQPDGPSRREPPAGRAHP